MSSLGRMAALTGLLSLPVVIPPAAQAASLCTGNLRAAQVHPLPTPLTVTPERSIGDLSNPGLARRFADGMEQAGVTFGEQGNATLSLAISVTAPASGSTLTSGSYKGFEWMSGQTLSSSYAQTRLRNAYLSISAVMTDNKAINQSWVATIDCRVQTDDPGALAQFIGTTLGRTVGQNIDRRPL